ncbi:MAG TPA: sugar phosphate isomerase/epimerase family protein [Methanolinea sp.]|nr:sugar phosphate isomerase/epimerase family protein [Methanolinea sp.]
MELGISSYCLIGRPLAETLDTLSGITGLIEVMDEGPHLITDPAVFESYSQDFVIHAPYHGMNIASLFEGIRRASVEVMIDCFAIAAEIGAPVVMHPGYHAWNTEKEAADRQFRISLHQLQESAADHSLTFWFENMGELNYFHFRTPDDIPSLGDSGFCLDCGHANLNHCLPAFLETDFSHMHIHDNDGRRDTHNAVGEGTIDFRPVMAALERTGATAVLEVKDLEGVLRSREVLDRL